MTVSITNRSIVVAVVLIAMSLTAAGAAPAVSAHENATDTSTAASTTATESTEACTPAQGAPVMQVVDLHTREDTISANSPGQISGEFVTDGTNNCAVKVQITLNVPNNVYIQSTGDVMSGGSGLVTATFVVEPGNAKSIRAEVFGTEVGQHTVTADITYWPVGHKDMAKEQDGMMLTFTVDEPNSPTPAGGGSNGDECTGTLAFLCGIPLQNGLFGLISVTLIGLLLIVGIAVSRDHVHNVKTILKRK